MPADCKFSYYAYGDDKGKRLADNAKQECLRNNELKASGRAAEISLEHYGYWSDHRRLSSQDRNAAIARDEQMLRDLQQQQRDHQRQDRTMTCTPGLMRGTLECR